MPSLALRQSELLVKRDLLKRLPAELLADFAAASEQNGRDLSAAIARSAPVSEDEDPGQLRRSVGYKVEGTKVTVKAGGDEAPHALHVEHGTRKMTAQPFFFPTYRLMKKRLWSRYGRALTKRVKQRQS